MFEPGIHNEREALLGYLEQQLSGLRATAHGLTDTQARATPTRSALSIGALLKHTASICEATADFVNDTTDPDKDRLSDYYENLTMAASETLDAVLARFDAGVAAYLGAVATLDPDAPLEEAAAPWYGRNEPTPSNVRFRLLHHVEEFARHAGHADIIREQIDGANSASLFLAINGLPGNDFVQPWTPQASSA